MLQEQETKRLRGVFNRFPAIKVALIFGSVARGRALPKSDLDVAVAALTPLDWQQKMRLIEELALVALSPIDLLDLQTAHGVILKRALSTGSILFCNDRVLYAGLIKRMLFEQADFNPCVQLILKYRRERWIGTS